MRENVIMRERATHPRAVGGSAGNRNTLSRRVHDMLLASMHHGIYAEDQVLVEDQLIAHLDASRTAVREALRKLADEGVVERHPRSGTIVVNTGVRIALEDIRLADGPSDEMDIVITEQRTVPSTSLLRTRLSTSDRRLRMVENTFALKGAVIGIRTAYFRCSFEAVSYDGRAAMSEVAARFFGRTVSRIDTSIGATTADARTARILGIAEGSAVVVRNQTFYDSHERPIQIAFDHYRADRVTFVHGRPSTAAVASPHLHATGGQDPERHRPLR